MTETPSRNRKCGSKRRCIGDEGTVIPVAFDEVLVDVLHAGVGETPLEPVVDGRLRTVKGGVPWLPRCEWQCAHASVSQSPNK